MKKSCRQPQSLPGKGRGTLFVLIALHLAAGAIPAVIAIEGLGAAVEWSAPKEVASGFQFTEGPVWHPDGFLLFSDVSGNRIVKWTAPDKVETFRQPSGNSNGLIFDREGKLIACEHGNRRVSRTEPDEKIISLADRYEGKRLNSPNDLAMKSDGSVYFTDPPYGISAEQKELPFNGVFRISAEGELTLLVADFDRPNGLAFSPDENKLYIADTTGGHIRVFEVLADGTLKGGEQFVQVSSPDGMKVDSEGNLFVASQNGVMVFDPQGETIGTIGFPEQPSNCCFGDPDGRALFVTARTSVYKVRLYGFPIGEISVDKKRNLVVTWNSFLNRRYAIYRSSDLLTWELAADNVSSMGDTVTTWMDGTRPLFSPEIRRRYYRVEEKP